MEKRKRNILIVSVAAATALIITAVTLLIVFLPRPSNVSETVPIYEWGDKGINFDKKIETIVAEGETDYTIVYSGIAAPANYFATSEMQSFIGQITGVAPEVLTDTGLTFDANKKYISIGKTTLLEQSGIEFDYDTLNGDGFFMKTVGNSLFIDGANDRGVIYGVYDFLEVMTGLRFISYDHTYIPSLKSLDLYQINRVQIPAFRYRGYLNTATHARNELFAVRTRNTHEFVTIPENHGGNIGWNGAAGTVHNSLQYVPASKYYTNYPEMYYTIPGTNKPADLCMTHGITDEGTIDETMAVSTIKVAIESLKDFVSRNDESVKFYMFGQMDITTSCECETCVRHAELYKKSGIMVRFANLLSSEVEKWAKENYPGREVNVVVFAYYYNEIGPSVLNDAGEYMPIHETVIPNDNVYIRIAPLTSNFYYSYTDEKQKEVTKTVFKTWKNVHDKFMIWSYHADFQNNFWYFPTMHNWQNQLNFLKDYGVEYVMMQASYYDITQAQYNMDGYVASRLLWDPNQDVNALRREYVHHYFGTAAESFVMDYLNTFDLHYHLETENNELDMSDSDRYKAQYYPLSLITAQIKRLDDAIAATLADESITPAEAGVKIKRLKQLRLSPKYMLLHNYETYYLGDSIGKYYFAQSFFVDCDELGVSYFAEFHPIQELKDKYGF